jgi:serine/threonine protein kinase
MRWSFFTKHARQSHCNRGLHSAQYRRFGNLKVVHGPDLERVARAICAAEGYSFVSRKGGGVFKETYHITLSDGTPCALKVFRPGFSAERTDREIDAMTRCEHPNIGKLYSVRRYQFGGVEFFVSLEEYLAGGTLTERVRRAGLLSATEGRVLGEQLILAV